MSTLTNQSFESLECSLCKDTFRNPKSLQCFHTFCCECLELYLEKNSTSTKISCPLCRSPFLIPENGVEELLPNVFILNSLCSQVKIQKKEICESCEELEPTSFCLQCQQYLCPNCVLIHKRLKATTTHEYASYEQIKNGEAKMNIVYCRHHSHKEIELYCKNCEIPLCTLCINNHNFHSICQISEAAGESLKSEIRQLIDQCLNRSIEIESVTKEIDQRLDHIEINSKQIENEISFSFQRIRKLVDERECQLLNELEKMKHLKKKELSVQNEDLKFMKESISTGCTFASKTLQKGNDVEFVLTKNLILSRLNYLSTCQFETQPCQDSQMAFSEDQSSSFFHLLNSFGSITTNNTSPEMCIIEGIDFKKSFAYQPISFTIKSFSQNGKVEKGGDIYHIQVNGSLEEEVIIKDLQNGSYLVYFTPNKIGEYIINIFLKGKQIKGSPFIIEILPVEHFDQIQKPKFKIGSYGQTTGQFDCPHAVTINSLGQIIVIDSGNHRIQVFDENGKFSFKFGSFGNEDGQLSKPYDIVNGLNDTILVADTNNHRIQIFSAKGDFITKFGSNGNGDSQFSFPYGMAIDSNNNIIVADSGNSRIQVFDSNGKFLQSFGTEGKGDGEFEFPTGVAVDSKGNIIVCEYGNNRIQIFDSNGNFIKKFGIKGNEDGQFDSAFRISVDIKDSIYVADQNNNRIQIFDQNGNFIAKFGLNQISQPLGIFVDRRNQTLAVTEYFGNRVLVF